MSRLRDFSKKVNRIRLATFSPKKTARELLRLSPPPKRLKGLLRGAEGKFLKDYLKDYLTYLAKGEFGKIQVLLKELDYQSLKFFVPSLTEEQFYSFRNYLISTYYYIVRLDEQKKELLEVIKQRFFEKLPKRKLKKEQIRYFLLALKNKKGKQKPQYRGYKNLQYRVALFANDKFEVVDARIFATKNTLNKYREIALKKKLYILVQPNPVKIPKGFWEEYRKAKTSKERIRLVRNYSLLKDEQAVYIQLIWDLDSPYEEVEPVVKEFLKDLGIEEEPFRVLLERTASGRARLIILLRLWLDPTKKHGNGHTHLENIKEALAIVAAYFQQKGLNVDLTFVDRPNHQIWDIVAHPKEGKYEVLKAVPTLNRIRFYDLYRRLKKLQKEKELYYLKRGGKEINLTTYFGWKKEPKRIKKVKVLKVPKFIVERLNDRAIENLKADVKLYYWKKAVKKLAERVSDYRYTKVISPAIGWAKHLNLDRYEVERYLKEVLSDRGTGKNEHDIEIAWERAPEIEFKLPKGIRTLDFHLLVKEALKVLAREGEVARQDLIKLLGHQKWLTDLLTGAFEKVGLITSRFVKAGRGRPKKVFALTEKGRLVAANLSEETLNELWRVAVGQDFSSTDFSQYKNSLSLKVGVGETAAATKEFKQELINLTKIEDFRVNSAGGGAQIRVVAPEAEGPKPPENSPKVSEKPKEAAHPPKDEVSKAEEILRRLREGKPKRGGGISSLGEILGFD